MFCDEKKDDKFNLIMLEKFIKNLSNFKNLKYLKEKFKIIINY